jgi:hypothetical protein
VRLHISTRSDWQNLPIILCTGFSDRVYENMVAYSGVKALW